MNLAQDVLPSDFLDHLRETFAGLESLPFKHQFEIGKMIWGTATQGRSHKHFEDALSFHYADLDAAFGRGGFSRINDRFQLFDVSKNWSAQDRWTRGYRFTPKLEESFDCYRRQKWPTATSLLRGDGKERQTTPKKAVAPKDLRGSNATRWPFCANLNHVPVCIDALEVLRSELATLFDRSSERHEDAYKSTLSRWLSATACVIRLSITEPAGHGVMAHRYVEAESGRLYAQGLSLQNAPRLVKSAALTGLWEYDFSNCHYTIFEQMCRRLGFICGAIPEYLSAKSAVRREIAAKAGISIAQAKECLIAIIYGASTSHWHKNAIPKAIGMDAAKRLASVPIFRELRQEIKGGTKQVLSRWPRLQNGRLKNEVGKAIVSSARPMQLMAHLIQGVEARSLKCALELFPDDIVLLQHDGFASRSRLDMQKIVSRTNHVTGYELLLEEEQLRFSPCDVASKAGEEG